MEYVMLSISRRLTLQTVNVVMLLQRQVPKYGTSNIIMSKTFHLSAMFAMYLHGMISNCNIDRSVTRWQRMFLGMKSVDSQFKLQQVHVYTSFDPQNGRHVNFIESI